MSNVKKGKHRVTVTIDDDMYEKLNFAIEQTIAMENGDYDLPKAEILRLNQLIETISVLSSDVKSLESVTIHGFDSLLNLTRGDNYLLEEEDGEIY